MISLPSSSAVLLFSSSFLSLPFSFFFALDGVVFVS